MRALALWFPVFAILGALAYSSREDFTHPCPSGGSCQTGYACPSYANPLGPCVPGFDNAGVQ